jgi:hypothetical protein
MERYTCYKAVGKAEAVWLGTVNKTHTNSLVSSSIVSMRLSQKTTTRSKKARTERIARVLYTRPLAASYEAL